MRTVLDITKEPTGATYEALLRCVAEYCATFSLVWWEDPRLKEPPSQLWTRLRPFLQTAEQKSEWPGTELHGHTRLVTLHGLTDESLSALLSVRSLFSWLGAGRPEDLAFYSEKGSCAFGSIAHEKDAFIYIDIVPLPVLEKRVPDLQFRPPES